MPLNGTVLNPHYPALFNPVSLGGHTLRNRIIHASIVTKYVVNHAPTEALLNYYRSRAAGGAAAIDTAYREGQGQYVQQQGPFPQQLQADGVGHVVAQVGPKIGPNAFSSLAAMRDWLGTDEAAAFSRAYRKTRAYMNETPAMEIAVAQKEYFPDIDRAVLADCINTYPDLGCWTPHPEITVKAFDVAQDVFVHFGSLKKKVDYDQAVVAPPG